MSEDIVNIFSVVRVIIFIVVRIIIFMIFNAISFSGVNVIISSVSELNNPSLSTSHSEQTATMAACDLMKLEW
jgi:hypothetical protein